MAILNQLNQLHSLLWTLPFPERICIPFLVWGLAGIIYLWSRAA